MKHSTTIPTSSYYIFSLLLEMEEMSILGCKKVKIKISLLQAMEAHRVARG
jgi:hypothetical protein